MAEEIREVRAEETAAYFNMSGQAFQVPVGDLERWRQNTPLSEIRGLFVDGEMRAGLVLIPMQMWFGAGTVRAGGISGVATPPEYRRQGYIGRLLDVVAAEMRGDGYPLSILYPFYFPFYKRYGWAHVSDNLQYTIPIERLPVVKQTGSWHSVAVTTDLPKPGEGPVVSDADLAILMGIYDAWAPGRNGPLVRAAAHWRRRKLSRPANIYYWRDPSGEPRAYVVYTFKETAPWTRQVQIREMIALDGAALRAVFGFLRNHDSQAQEVVADQPEAGRLLALLDDPRIKVEVDPGFMLRILDVPAALEARRYPAGVSGNLALQVTPVHGSTTPVSGQLAVNDGAGSWAPTRVAPALSLDERVLGQLYTGYLTPTQAADLGLLTVHDPAGLAQAEAVFAGPRPYLPDFF
jgi:predicted acetyltransferase